MNYPHIIKNYACFIDEVIKDIMERVEKQEVREGVISLLSCEVTMKRSGMKILNDVCTMKH